MPTTCCVVNCGSRGDRDIVKFFKIPSELHFAHRVDLNELSKKRRQKWIQAIKREDLTETKLGHSRVCSKHFISGKEKFLFNKLKTYLYLLVCFCNLADIFQANHLH